MAPTREQAITWAEVERLAIEEELARLTSQLIEYRCGTYLVLGVRNGFDSNA
jgi:hypothetical protein